MILTGLVGFAIERLLAVPSATAFGILLGMLAAPLVPSPNACGVRPRRPERDHDAA